METPNYKETNIVGQKWQRACRVVVENPIDSTPSVLFVEEEVIKLNDVYIKSPKANLSAAFDINNTLHMEIYTKLNELYTLLRDARDLSNSEGI